MTVISIPETRPGNSPSSTAHRVDESRILLHNISWETYESLLRDVENDRVRLTYDTGVLEIMSPSAKRDRSGRLLSRLIYVCTEETKTDIGSFPPLAHLDLFRISDFVLRISPLDLAASLARRVQEAEIRSTKSEIRNKFE